MPRNLYEELIRRCLIELGVTYQPYDFVMTIEVEIQNELEQLWNNGPLESLEFDKRFTQWIIDQGLNAKRQMVEWIRQWYSVWRKRDHYFKEAY